MLIKIFKKSTESEDTQVYLTCDIFIELQKMLLLAEGKESMNSPSPNRIEYLKQGGHHGEGKLGL